MKQSSFHKPFLAATFALFIAFPCLASARPPNVILIMADDFGIECVTAHGGESYNTPNLDRLAATGMRFDNCHVQPLCTPTRVQLMTGQYNVRNYTRFGHMEPDSRTFANVFRDAGYATAIVGKWQLGQDTSLPKRWGFDEHALWQLTRRPERFRNPGLEINGKEADYTNAEYGPDIVCDYALDFMTRNKDKPFLLYYPMILTHDPFVPTPDSPDYNDPRAPRKGRAHTNYFAHMVAYADKLVGRIADKLDELEIRDNTLLIFTGDNGTHSAVTSRFRGRPYEGGKGKRIQTATHVPLIVNWPGRVPAGRVNLDLVDSTDFFATICDAAGLAIPRAMTMDGRSFWPQLRGRPGSPREWSYFWYSRNGQEANFEFARDVRFKLYREGGFFDLQNDPEEMSALDDDEASEEPLAARVKLEKVLEQFRDARPASLSSASK